MDNRTAELILQEAAELVVEDFELIKPDVLSGMEGLIFFENIREMLKNEVFSLMNNDFPKLIDYLYRIDISEEALKKVTGETDAEHWPEAIADTIIQRELQKVKRRRAARAEN